MVTSDQNVNGVDGELEQKQIEKQHTVMRASTSKRNNTIKNPGPQNTRIPRQPRIQRMAQENTKIARAYAPGNLHRDCALSN